MISRWLQEKGKRKSFKEVFSGEEGQDVIAMLANAHYVFRTSHAGDPYTSAWQEGQRSVVLKIMEMVDTDLRVLRTRYDQQELARIKRQDNN